MSLSKNVWNVKNGDFERKVISQWVSMFAICRVGKLETWDMYDPIVRYTRLTSLYFLVLYEEY